MKKLLYTLMLLAAAATGLVACSGDDDTTEVTSDCYISAFQMKALKRIVTTISSTGADSDYVTTTNASAMLMRIDHKTGTITNVEPLPLGSQLDKVLITLTAYGTVIHAQQNDTTAWTVYSSTDSLDFTSPRIFRVLANNGHGWRDYTVTLNVREDNAYNYTWQRQADLTAMAGMVDAKLLTIDGHLRLISRDAAGVCYADGTPCQGLPSDAEVRSAVVYGDQLWMTTASGNIFRSADGSVWQQVAQTEEALRVQLFAASHNALYSITHDTQEAASYAVASSTDGHTWTPMAIENMAFTDAATGIAYTQTNGNARVLLLADVYNDDTEAPLFSWSLLEGSGEAWLPFNDTSTQYALPRWQYPTIVTYNNWLMALGDGERSGAHATLSTIYISYDNGVNWKTDSYLAVPDELQNGDGPLTAATVGEYIHIVRGQQHWTVRYNSFGE